MSVSQLLSPPLLPALRRLPAFSASSLPLRLRRRCCLLASATADGIRTLSIGCSPEPPWPIPPPAPLEHPFPPSLSAPPAAGPPSLRMIQVMRRLPSTTSSSPPDTPATRAVATLLFMIGELQRPTFEGQEALDRVSRDRRESFLWLFCRVFSNSPNLIPMVLTLLSHFIALSAQEAGELATLPAMVRREGAGKKTIGGEVDLIKRPDLAWDFKSWVDVGIRNGEVGNEMAAVERRRWAYERVIAQGEVNSLFLCNYAQLLYRFTCDYDRAEHYFKLASMAEPRDAEAIGHYALFTWEARGDVLRAEELFLEALEIDPDSFYHSSKYAWFLWKMGAEDTCYPM